MAVIVLSILPGPSYTVEADEKLLDALTIMLRRIEGVTLTRQLDVRLYVFVDGGMQPRDALADRTEAWFKRKRYEVSRGRLEGRHWPVNGSRTMTPAA